MSRLVVAFLAVLLTMMVMESVWFAVVVERLYRPELGALLTDDVRILPAVAFYLLYPACVVVLAVRPLHAPVNVKHSFGRGVTLGLAAYGAYELTNLATITGWSARVTVVDIAWGAFLTSFGAAASAIVSLRIFANSSS